MKKRWGILLIVFMALAVGLPWILWQMAAPKELGIMILDKTVPDSSYREHRGIMWLLNNQKYIKKDTKESYDYKVHYYGFFPKENKEYVIRDLPTVIDSTGIIYIADTYGVYTQEYYGKNQAGDRSDLIYGGIQLDEIEKIRKAMYSRSTTLIAEFNTFGSPTDEAAKKALYELLGLNWTGWIGRYFEDLSKEVEVPNWAVQNYETQQGVEWNFTGNGFLFVNEQDKVVVLGQEDISRKGALFRFTQEGEAFFGKRGSCEYQYWFDIIDPDPSSDVLASYDLKLNPSGVEKLKSNGIPINFPAVTRNHTEIYTSYYFSGDFTDYSNTPGFYQLAGWTNMMEILAVSKEDAFYWKVYVPMMKKILEESRVNQQQNYIRTNSKQVFTDEGTKMVARTQGKMLQVYKNDQWEELFIKGVNMGMALPGKWFTEFPQEENIYLRWFEMIGEMKANTIRVYTLMHPSFYRALLKYNVQNKDNPLWLLQEIWPEEHPEGNDYYNKAYMDEYFIEIEHMIDAIHGNATIPKRRGRAYGEYYVDVSPYILGFLVGRELEPEEVIQTNKKNNINHFDGSYLVIKRGSPTEIWLAESCEYVLSYQQDKYGWQHPVAIVSWPTLDVMEHDAEWNVSNDKSLEYNDSISIDIRNFLLGEKMKAGFFGAYHIYPNYPDFMNNTAAYGQYKDEEGTLQYGGYLQHFMQYHEGYPAVVAEFGLATGMGNAHANTDGYHHGAMTEKEQGNGVIRMMKAIDREGYAGGIIFEWMDEWAKKTWITEPFMIPYEHNVFLHNAIDPEQNYGILAMESVKPEEVQYSIEGSNEIKRATISGNEAYLYIDIVTDEPVDWMHKKLLIGLDTYDPEKGTFYYNQNVSLKAPTGMEFLVELTGKEGKLLVIPEYNIAKYNFASVENSQGPFEVINPIINTQRVTKSGEIIEEIRQDGSSLNYGEFMGSYHHWYQKDHLIHLRLPWGRLNITDPTTYQVLDDRGEYLNFPTRDHLETTTTEGIRMTVILIDEASQVVDQLPNTFEEKVQPFLWTRWGEPRYVQRVKESYYLIKDYFIKMKD